MKLNPNHLPTVDLRPRLLCCASVLLLSLAACIVTLLTVPVSRAQDAKPVKPVDPQLVKTFTAKTAVKLNEAVADFVIDLVHKNTAGVQDQYRKFTAKTEEDAGGRYSARRFEGIQWFVNEHAVQVNAGTFETRDDYTYLARQQLVFGVHRGFSTPVNVVAQVRVLTSLSHKGEGPAVKDGVASPGTKVTLSFEGFLNSVPVQAPE